MLVESLQQDVQNDQLLRQYSLARGQFYMKKCMYHLFFLVKKMHVSSAFSKVVLPAKVAINRFRKLKEEEEKKTKALPTEDVQTLVSTSDSDDDQDEETKDKVKFDS